MALFIAPAGAQTPAAVPQPAAGAEERWGVMSVLGDDLLMVLASPAGASRIDRGDEQVQKIPGSGFDRASMAGARAALARAQPTGAPRAYVPTVQFTASEQREIVDLLARGTRIPWLQDLAEKDGVTHLVLITRDTGSAVLKTVRGDSLGERRVDGVGFYIDRDTRIRVLPEDVLVSGFLGPFVYLRASLFDVKANKMVRHETVQEGVAYGSGVHNPKADPWQIMDNTQKVMTLRKMIQENVERAVGKLARP